MRKEQTLLLARHPKNPKENHLIERLTRVEQESVKRNLNHTHVDLIAQNCNTEECFRCLRLHFRVAAPEEKLG